MTSLGLAAVLHVQLAMLASGAETYTEAHKVTTETGRPMVVMIGAEWCPACVQLKDEVLPKVRQHGLLRKVAFAVVDLDREKELGAELTKGGPIPQLLMFRRTKEGWRVRRMIGSQSVDKVEGFINEGLQTDGSAKQADVDGKKPAESPATENTTAAPSGGSSPEHS